MAFNLSEYNNRTAAQIKTDYEGNADTNEFSDAEQTKLANIEALADVTDATNVAAAGAVMVADTDASSFGFIIDEDNLVSDDATKVPTQQSVKAYIDAAVVGGASFKGDYDANTNTPNLDTAPAGILQGDTYVVNVAGTAFFSETLEVGDQLLAKQDDPTTAAHWSIVQANLTAATIKSQYESNADTNAFTDANVTDLAKATLNDDADVSTNTWVVDEDDMVSDLATKVPTQQSVKAYIDAAVGTPTNVVLVSAGTASTNAAVGDLIVENSSTQTKTVVIPSGASAGDVIQVQDGTEDAGTNAVTVDFTTNTQTLFSTAQQYVINVAGGGAKFIFVGGSVGWIAQNN